MRDEIVIAQALNGTVRIHIARTRQLVQEAVERHQLQPTSAAALGRTMTVTAIMASDLKGKDEKITAILNGGGPAGTVLAQANGNGDVRGFIGDPNLHISRADGHLDVGAAVGNHGDLQVIKDIGLKEPFTGVAPIQTGEIGIDFAYYYAISEQTPTIVNVGVLVGTDRSIETAGGMIVQLLPGAPEETIEFCEKVSQEMSAMTELLKKHEELEDIVLEYFPDAEFLDTRDVRWKCNCSREHFMVSLGTLAEEDLLEMINDGQGAEVRCDYCNSYYFYNTDELKAILEAKRAGNRRS